MAAACLHVRRSSQPMDQLVTKRGASWQRSLRNGVVLGVVLAFHGGLALFLLAGRSGLRSRPLVSAPSSRNALLVEFLPSPSADRSPQRARRAVVAPAQHRHLMKSHPRPRVEKAPAPVAETQATSGTLDLDLPARDPTRDFGNHAWRQAIDEAQSALAPRLPGVEAGASVIRLIPRQAAKERVGAVGKFMNCSIAIMKRHAHSDTPQQINHAHDEYGCTK